MPPASLDSILREANVLAQTADHDEVQTLAELVHDLAFHVKGWVHYISVELWVEVPASHLKALCADEGRQE